MDEPYVAMNARTTIYSQMKPDNTQYIDNSPEDIALTHWSNGGLVAIPTETVYGLAADATQGAAVAKIYALKNRPSFNPLIAHVDGAAMAQRYVIWSDAAEKLAQAFWPGPITLVLPLRADSGISPLATDGGDTLGVRAPNHGVTLQLIRAYGKPLVAPSANRSGRISPTTAQHVRDEFGEHAPLIIDGGACQVGIESTVLDLTGAVPVLLRPGAITQAMIVAILGVEVVLPPAGMSGDGRLKSPGLLTRHYAPTTPLRLDAEQVHAGEALLAYGMDVPDGAAHVFYLSRHSDIAEAASRLFEGLRVLDACGASRIAVMPLPTEGIGAAMHDRLIRASAAE